MTTRSWHSVGRGIPAAICICALASAARADGCFVWKRGADLHEPSQKAIIHWHDGTETMVLQVKYEGPAEDFAWIVPLPARPKVSAIEAEKSPFAEISLYTQGRARWGHRGKDGEPAQKVEVLERKVVGVYDVAVLAAGDAKALGDWLNKHGYAFPKDRADVLGHYTKKKWVYVAMRIDRKALATDEVRKLKTGELQPIRFTFAAKELVYPLRISCVNAGATEVLLYLLAGAPMVLKAGPSGEDGRGFDPRTNMMYMYAQRPYTDPEYGTFRKATGEALPLTWSALGLKRDSAWHLCKCRSRYQAKDMSDDLTFAAFDPLAYWRQHVPKADPYRAARNLAILAEHDERTYGPLLRKVLDRLLAMGDVSGRWEVARNPAAPPELLDRLADDKDDTVQRCVAGNRRTPGSALRRLAKSDSRSVPYFLAGNPGAPPDVLAKLLDGANEDVLLQAVRNPNLRPEDLRAKLKTGSAVLRRCAARCGKTDPEILAELAKDESEQIRAYVACNPGMPAAMLAELAKDESHRVRWSVAVNPAAPPEALTALASDENAEVRHMVAGNPRTPEPVLIRLSQDEIARVREGVARNREVPPMLLLVLANDPAPQVRSYAGGPGTTGAVLANLAGRDSRPQVRRFVAAHAETHATALERLSRDPDMLVRLCVALNPSTPDELLRKLARDRASQVSQAAKQSLANRKQPARPASEGG